MSNFQETFILKQYTPLIHFQSSHKGATIRASELKPKLDRFLIKYAFDNDEQAYSSYLIKGKEFALDYKVSIIAHNTKVIPEVKNKTYFGNMNKKPYDKDYRKTVMADMVEVRVFSYHTELISYIQKFFSSFLAIENFGTRQSKGFGSFYLSNEDKHYKPPKQALDDISSCYVYGVYEELSSLDIFAHVEVIYPLMKSGINYPDRYAKANDKNSKASYYRSFLFKYMYEKHSISNEKRFIKENFFDAKVRIEPNSHPKRYVRALLGVADGIMFRDDQRRGRINYKHQNIKRFKSPLTFKIIEDTLFIIAHSNTMILDQTFKFTSKEPFISQNIKTPSDFDINDFLYSFVDDFNSLEVEKIKNIFDKKILNARKARFVKGGKR